MSIKSLIREALSSHLGSKCAWVSAQSFPGNAVEYTPAIATDDNDQWMHFVAPSDGWFCVSCGMRGRFVDIEVRDRYGTCTPAISNENGPGRLTLPVRSGDAVDIHLYVNALPSDDSFVRFFPTVGSPTN